MRKNITINMFGALYNIDEDAYELLYRYLEDMKRYFNSHDDGEEIYDDIEHRVAELLSELKSSGAEAITIEHIESIIRRVGSPEQMEGDSTDEEIIHKETKNGKTLFRNPDDKKIAGVISGIACYLAMDTLTLRLIFVIIVALTQGWILLAYLIAWIIIPEAKTPEDKLRMQGKKVNMENLREEILHSNCKDENVINSSKPESKTRGCLSIFMDFLVILFKFIILILLGSITLSFVLGFIFILFCIGVMLYASIAGFSSLYIYNTDAVLLDTIEMLPAIAHWGFWISSISLLIILSVPIYVFIHWIRGMFGKSINIPNKTRNMLLLIWLSALVLFGIFTTTTFMTVSKIYIEEHNKAFPINRFYVPKLHYKILIQDK